MSQLHPAERKLSLSLFYSLGAISMDRLDDTTQFGGTLSFTHSTDLIIVPLQTHPVDTTLNVLTAL